MSTLTGLIGGGGGGIKVVTDFASPGGFSSWVNHQTSNVNINSGGTSTLTDVFNLTSAEGYFNWLFFQCTSSNSIRFVITVDGTQIMDKAANSSANNYHPVYPHRGVPVGSDSSFIGAMQSALPLRFESSLRVQCGTSSGVTASCRWSYALT